MVPSQILEPPVGQVFPPDKRPLSYHQPDAWSLGLPVPELSTQKLPIERWSSLLDGLPDLQRQCEPAPWSRSLHREA